MVRSPLDSSFEDAAQGDEVVIKKPPKKKVAQDTSNRSAEDGGRAW
jgi:hypothetical protein